MHKGLCGLVGVLFILWSVMLTLLGAFGYSMIEYWNRSGLESVGELNPGIDSIIENLSPG